MPKKQKSLPRQGRDLNQPEGRCFDTKNNAEGKCPGEFCKNAVNGSTFEMAHHHFAKRLNFSLPNVTALLKDGTSRACLGKS